ncbi:integrase core domain-containing protein [Pseudarthrobacter sp. SL88]|uniref:integrase core domain-containing protein n=1 Tax=Pseudarthrobacter sp. SL88 TaxID=2994666 RepID=UPI003FA34DF0
MTMHGSPSAPTQSVASGTGSLGGHGDGRPGARRAPAADQRQRVAVPFPQGPQTGPLPGATRSPGRQPAERPAPPPHACGKLERYHRTFKEYYADHGPAPSIEALQHLCDAFRWHYNHERPHRSLEQQTPAAVYTVSRKATPTDGRRVRSSPRVLKVSSAGSVNFRRRKINIGQAYSGEHVRVIDGPEQVMISPRRHRRNPAPAYAGTRRHLPRQRCQTRASLQTTW